MIEFIVSILFLSSILFSLIFTKKYKLLVIIIAILKILVYISRIIYKKKQEVLLNCELLSANKKKVNNIILSNPNTGYGFTYSIWFYLSKWKLQKRTRLRHILKSHNLNISIGSISRRNIVDSNKNNLTIKIKTLGNGKENININNIPIQKWLNIIVIVNGRNIDIFLNGKLYISKFLKTLPLIRKGKAILCPNGGFDGYIGHSKYINYAIGKDKIIKIFNKGSKCKKWFKSKKYKDTKKTVWK